MDIKQQALDILNGNAEAPSQFVEYLAKRALESRDEGHKLLNQIKEINGRLDVLRARALELKGATDCYVDDIGEWLGRDAVQSSDGANGGTKFTDEERAAMLTKEAP